MPLKQGIVAVGVEVDEVDLRICKMHKVDIKECSSSGDGVDQS